MKLIPTFSNLFAVNSDDKLPKDNAKGEVGNDDIDAEAETSQGVSVIHIRVYQSM